MLRLYTILAFLTEFRETTKKRKNRKITETTKRNIRIEGRTKGYKRASKQSSQNRGKLYTEAMDAV